MVLINFAKRRIAVKLALVGPTEAGVTTVFEHLRCSVPGEHEDLVLKAEGQVASVTLHPEGLTFDPGPLPPGVEAKPGCDTSLGKVGDMDVEYELAARHGDGPVAWRALLEGVDGLLFVADSSPARLDANERSLATVDAALDEQGLALRALRHVFLWNKRDLPAATPVEDLDRRLNAAQAPAYEGVGTTGAGVVEAFARLAGAILASLNKQYCSCTFDPDRVRLLPGSHLELNLASGVFQAVSARDSARASQP